jgi:hypothetical protein
MTKSGRRMIVRKSGCMSYLGEFDSFGKFKSDEHRRVSAMM